MAQFSPFRTPVNTEDSPEQQWSAPDYFTPEDKTKKWEPPEYFKASKSKTEEPSGLKKIWSKVSEPLTEAPTRAAEYLSKKIDPNRETKGAKALTSAFVEGVGHAISGLTSPLNLAFAGAGIGESALKEAAPEIAQALRTGSRVLSAPVAAEGATNLYKGVRDRDLPETLSGGLEAGLGIAGMRGSPKIAEEKPSIRQPKSKELAYRMGGSVQEVSKEPISIAKEEVPVKQEAKKPFVNPFEKKKVEEIQQDFNDGKINKNDALDQIQEVIKTQEEPPLPTRSPNLDPERFQIGEETPKPPIKPEEDILYDIARKKFNMGEELPKQEWKAPEYFNPIETPTSSHGPTNEYYQGKKYDLSMSGGDAQYAAGRSKGRAFRNWAAKKAEAAKEPDIVEKGTVQLGQKQEPIIEHPLINPKTGEAGTPESLHPQLTALRNYGDGVLHLEFDKSANATPESVKALFPDKNVDVTEMYTDKNLPSRFRVDVQGSDPVDSAKQGDDIERSVGGAFDKEQTPRESLITGESGFAKIKKTIEQPIKGPYGAALDKLFSSIGKTSEQRVQQDIINKTERAKRFAAFSGVKQEGMAGAKQSLSALKGEFEKVDPEKLLLNPKEADTLFTAVKRARITEGEKARGYTALFKLLNGEQLPQRNELVILNDVFGNNFADRVMEFHGGIGMVGIKLSKAANTMKSMENALSLAAPLRHGIGLIARKEFYPAFADMFKFFGNKEYYNTAMQAIEERPNYMLGRESDLFLAKPGSLMNAEEEFLNSYVGSIPGVRNVVGASQRAYSGFLNKLRSDTFDSMVKQAKNLGNESFTQVGDQMIPSKSTKAIARFINNATGRGDLGSLNKMTNELNLLLWSPRMIASRVNMFANPKIYMDLPKGMRMEGLKSLLGIAALGTAIDTLAAYGGAKVSTNILSTDFGKSRFGTKLIDPWGGLQQYVVGAARFLAGKTDSSAPTSRLEIAGRFMANKESPAASLAHNLLTAKFTGGGNLTTQYGEKTNVQSQVAKQFVPIFIQDLNDLVQTEPDFSRDIGLDTALAGASLAGMAQDYPEKKKLGFRKLK